MKHCLLFAIFCLAITACSGESKTTITKKPETQQKQQNPTKKSSFADPQIQAYKKSQGVQDTLNDASKKRREEMENQGI